MSWPRFFSFRVLVGGSDVAPRRFARRGAYLVNLSVTVGGPRLSVRPNAMRAFLWISDLRTRCPHGPWLSTGFHG